MSHRPVAMPLTPEELDRQIAAFACRLLVHRQGIDGRGRAAECEKSLPIEGAWPPQPPEQIAAPAPARQTTDRPSTKPSRQQPKPHPRVTRTSAQPVHVPTGPASTTTESLLKREEEPTPACTRALGNTGQARTCGLPMFRDAEFDAHGECTGKLRWACPKHDIGTTTHAGAAADDEDDVSAMD